MLFRSHHLKKNVLGRIGWTYWNMETWSQSLYRPTFNLTAVLPFPNKSYVIPSLGVKMLHSISLSIPACLISAKGFIPYTGRIVAAPTASEIPPLLFL